MNNYLNAEQKNKTLHGADDRHGLQSSCRRSASSTGSYGTERTLRNWNRR